MTAPGPAPAAAVWVELPAGRASLDRRPFDRQVVSVTTGRKRPARTGPSTQDTFYVADRDGVVVVGRQLLSVGAQPDGYVVTRRPTARPDLASLAVGPPPLVDPHLARGRRYALWLAGAAVVVGIMANVAYWRNRGRAAARLGLPEHVLWMGTQFGTGRLGGFVLLAGSVTAAAALWWVAVARGQQIAHGPTSSLALAAGDSPLRAVVVWTTLLTAVPLTLRSMGRSVLFARRQIARDFLLTFPAILAVPVFAVAEGFRLADVVLRSGG